MLGVLELAARLKEVTLPNTSFKRNPQIRLTKELLVLALNSSSEAILIKDCDGIVLIGSQRVAEFLKCSVDDLPGRDSYEFLPRALAQSIRERDQHVMATGKAESIEETWDLGYDQRTLLVSRSPILDSEGRCVGVITCYTNISHIKLAFRLFEQNEKRFTALAQTCPVGIFECDPSHQLTYVNPEWERITGLTFDEVAGKHWNELIAKDQQRLVKHLQGNTDSQPGGDRIDCTIEGKNKCTVELSLNRVSDTHNNTVSYIGSIVDLTYRLAAQRELREKASLMRDLTRSVPAIIWQLTMDGQCVFTSDYFCTITGEPTEAALGESWESWIHEEDFPKAAASLGAVLSGEQQTASHEFRMKGKDNEWRWMLSNCQQIHSTDGKPIGVAGHTIDITDRRKAEEELQHYNLMLEQRVNKRTQELVSVNHSLVNEIENRQHAEELLEEKRAQLSHFSRVSVMGRLSGELAHELNQPLNAIQNYVSSLTQILSTSPVSEAASHVLTKLSGEITRAAKIIRRTRDFVSTGKHQPERLNLSELAADTAAMLKGEARRRGMTIQIVDVDKKSVVLGDPVRLQQVLVNLVLNALESMVDQPKSQKIATIEINSTPKRVRISVLDSGSGVNESQRSRLFDAFFTTKTNGLGMGLAISRGIIEDHQGTLNYAPQHSGGSSFIIDLPSTP